MSEQKTVLLIPTLDTKGPEALFAKGTVLLTVPLPSTAPPGVLWPSEF
jgi:hypothetical protein